MASLDVLCLIILSQGISLPLLYRPFVYIVWLLVWGFYWVSNKNCVWKCVSLGQYVFLGLFFFWLSLLLGCFVIFQFVRFWFILSFLRYLFFFSSNERQGVNSDGRRGGEDLGVGRGETIIRIYSMKKSHFQWKKHNNNKTKQKKH